MNRRFKAFTHLALIAGLVSVAFAMMRSSRVYAEKIVMGHVYVFRNFEIDAWILAFDRDRHYWEGSKGASMGIRLLEVFGRGSFVPTRSFRELEMIFPNESNKCCGWLVLPGRSAYSLYPIGSGLFLRNAADDSYLRWTGSDFVPCPDIGPYRQTEGGSYLSDEKRYSIWEQTELSVDRGERVEHKLDGLSIVLEWNVGSGWWTSSDWLELRITRGDEVVILRKDNFSHWTRSTKPPGVFPPDSAEWPDAGSGPEQVRGRAVDSQE